MIYKILFIMLISTATSSPVTDKEQESPTPPEVKDEELQLPPHSEDENKPQKNPVQVWFEDLSKNISASSSDSWKKLQEFFSGLNKNTNNPIGDIFGTSSGPETILGSFQVMRMPMPKMGDVIKGMGALGDVFNKIFTNGKLQ